MMRWAALLRGVNVGGNRKLPMADLRSFAEGLGLADARTLLASGNLVFSTDEREAGALETRLEAEARSALGLDTDFLLRNAADLDAVIAANPFPEAAQARPNHLLVLFHRDPVPPEPMQTLRHDGPERLAAVGRELFIDYPEGIGRSTLTPAMAKAKFPRCATARNWNTVLKLRALLA
ncbi:DUF1697 domain-containing protein [Stakelama saccharophila]|uniref:DUF1697 domain-containing protein n=1 Tax=Stakelama saccharophila TaxID=3075605 RepID=A0ABZ0B993_9SPHN|nr:DUF1697 domain-containing protein [Stakelama sp. W311]WNO53853.1 DUF1697 domain-containing protein [Stakelama sp. W311]